MINIRKIFQIILITALVCLFNTQTCCAQNKIPGVEDSFFAQDQEKREADEKSRKAECEKTCTQPGYSCIKDGVSILGFSCQKDKSKEAVDAASDVGAGTNSSPSDAAVTGCSSNYGLFSGLINTGNNIFKKLRDLIYVVAGFGIIGVAVGGFFGNINWKWLGAIIISLIVIASTGELINLITGCKNFTSEDITSTLIDDTTAKK